MSSVNQLVRIKRVREQARERERHSAASQLDSAQQRLVAMQERRLLEDAARDRRERDCYTELCKGPVRLEDIHLVYHQVECMKRDAHADLKREQDAETSRDQAQEHLQASRSALAAARVAHTKTSSLQEELDKDIRVRQVRSEDAAFDEVSELIDASRRAQSVSSGDAP